MFACAYPYPTLCAIWHRPCLQAPFQPLTPPAACLPPQRRFFFEPGQFADGQLYRFFAFFSKDGGKTWSGPSKDGYPYQTPA